MPDSNFYSNENATHDNIMASTFRDKLTCRPHMALIHNEYSQAIAFIQKRFADQRK